MVTEETRKCAECPDGVKAVCRRAFGRLWPVKSAGGRGCRLPLDGVAEAWRKRGWTPGAPQSRENAARSVPLGGRVIIALSCPADAAEGVSRAPGAPLRKAPRRPRPVQGVLDMEVGRW